MVTEATDQTACLALAQRQVGDISDWTSVQWLQQLHDDSVSRGEPAAVYFRPYRTALAYLSRPDRVKARSEGDVSEQYADDTNTLTRLQKLQDEWERDVIPSATSSWSGAIEWGGW